MRNQFAKTMCDLAQKNEEVILLYGDIGNRLFDDFKKRFPNRFFNCGVAEASMVGIAAGLARSGYRPFVYTINSFLYLKAMEQIKIDVCYSSLPVTLVGTGSALSYSGLGSTHHSLEDIGMLRTLPNLSIYAPANGKELDRALHSSLLASKPAYLRIGKKGEEEFPIEFNAKSQEVLPLLGLNKGKNSKLLVISTGTIATKVNRLISEMEILRNSVTHSYVPQLAPPPIEDLIRELQTHEKCLVIEEHNPIGALRSILAEILVENSHIKTQIFTINTRHAFHLGLGDLDEARSVLGLSDFQISETLRKLC